MNLISIFKTPIIEFLCREEDYGIIAMPYPAGGKSIPQWYKNIPTNTTSKNRDQFGNVAMTAKKCMPMIDAMNLGFIMPLYGDTNIRVDKTGKLIETNKHPQGGIIEKHGLEQLGGETSPTFPGPAIKFINRWIIKTAPGYSTLFTPPMNVMDPRFTCLSALVDTDTYQKEVNFPAVWHMKDCDETLLAGTPLVVAIPIKRSTVPKTAPVRVWTTKEMAYADKIHRSQQNRNHVYTNELRDKRK
jgi:hypothetical protein